MKTKNNTISLNQFIEKHYGVIGTKKRDSFEKGYVNFKLGAMLQEARLRKGLTQEALALKLGTTKSYISKIENDIKEIRLSNLQRLVEIGLDAKLELNIHF
jgi:ribosome-binding protein aMBF1 (putative translation factor)